MPDLALTKPDRGGRPLHRPSQKSRSKVDLLSDVVDGARSQQRAALGWSL